MKKPKVISAILSFLGITMIVIALVLESDISNNKTEFKTKKDNVNVVNMSSSNRVAATKVVDDEKVVASTNEKVEELSMEEAPQAEYIPPR